MTFALSRATSSAILTLDPLATHRRSGGVADARQQAQRILRGRDLGEDPSGPRMALRNAISIEQLCDEYVSDLENGNAAGKKASTVKSDISRIATHINRCSGNGKVTI
jgi:hypothetical protein